MGCHHVFQATARNVKSCFAAVLVGLFLSGFGAVALAWAQPPNTSQTVPNVPADASKEPSHPPVERLTKLAEGVYSSAAPEGSAQFEALKKLGIQTLITVDGTKPDVESARAAGLRYVHLPIPYSGMTDEQILAVARAVRDLPGPVLVHCHHGKHRGPAAAVSACVLLGKLPVGDAKPLLTKLGTDPVYVGLYGAAERAGAISRDRLATAAHDFPETTEIEPLAERMVAIDGLFDRLKTKPLPGTAAEDAALLRQSFTELRRPDSPRSTCWPTRGTRRWRSSGRTRWPRVRDGPSNWNRCS